MSVALSPKVTAAGLAALSNATNTGVKLDITHVQIGEGAYTPTGAETALQQPREVSAIAGGTATLNGCVISAQFITPSLTYYASEVAFWAGSPGTAGAVCFAIYSHPTNRLTYRSPVTDYTTTFTMLWGQLPVSAITIKVDPNQSAAIAAMTNLIALHNTDADPHTQYCTNAEVNTLMDAKGYATNTALANKVDKSGAQSVKIGIEYSGNKNELDLLATYPMGMSFAVNFVANANNTGGSYTTLTDGRVYGLVKTYNNGSDPQLSLQTMYSWDGVGVSRVLVRSVSQAGAWLPWQILGDGLAYRTSYGKATAIPNVKANDLQSWALTAPIPNSGLYDAYCTAAQNGLPTGYWYINYDRHNNHTATNQWCILTARTLEKGGNPSAKDTYENRCQGGVWTGWYRTDLLGGLKRTYRVVTASRAIGVTYTNTTAADLEVIVKMNGYTNGSMTMFVNGMPVNVTAATTNQWGTVNATVPSGATYMLSSSHPTGLWTELSL